MAPVDLSAVSYLLPILSFLIVAVVSFAVLTKIELFKHTFFQVFLSLLIASIFVTAIGAIDYVGYVVPWFAALLISLFLILLFTGFVGKDAGPSSKTISIIFFIGLMIVFLVSGVIVLTSYVNLYPYLPGSSGYGGNPAALSFTDWLYSPRVLGVFILAVVAALVSWFLVRETGKK